MIHDALALAPPLADKPTADQLRTHWRHLSERIKPPQLDKVMELAAQVAASTPGADKDQLVRIVYSRGDLQTYVSVLMTVEEDRIDRLRRAKAVQAVRRLLATADWPFDGEPLVDGPHPLSRATVEVVAAVNDVEKAREELNQIRDERRRLGVIQGPTSRSFQRAPVLRTIAQELYRYLIERAYAAADTNPLVRARVVELHDMERMVSRKVKGDLMRQSVGLVNLAFPAIARLTPPRVWGSAARRRD